MNEYVVPDPLVDLLERYCNVNALLLDDFRQVILEPKVPERAEAFRQQLAEAIINQSITPEQYETITGEDFDSSEELNMWLRELWAVIFGDEPIPGAQ